MRARERMKVTRYSALIGRAEGREPGLEPRDTRRLLRRGTHAQSVVVVSQTFGYTARARVWMYVCVLMQRVSVSAIGRYGRCR